LTDCRYLLAEKGGISVSMLKKLRVPSLKSEAAAEAGEDHTPDTHGYTPAHSGVCEVPF